MGEKSFSGAEARSWMQVSTGSLPRIWSPCPWKPSSASLGFGMPLWCFTGVTLSGYCPAIVGALWLWMATPSCIGEPVGSLSLRPHSRSTEILLYFLNLSCWPLYALVISYLSLPICPSPGRTLWRSREIPDTGLLCQAFRQRHALSGTCCGARCSGPTRVCRDWGPSSCASPSCPRRCPVLGN